jgi:predicted lipid-binding transport protein (Tim44 family)
MSPAPADPAQASQPSGQGPTGKQSAWIATLIVLLVGAITVTALRSYKIDEFLKVWAVIGTLVGVVTGAIPSFFFSNAAAAAQATAQQAQATARQVSLQHARAEEKTQTLLGFAEPALIERARALRPDLFDAGS